MTDLINTEAANRAIQANSRIKADSVVWDGWSKSKGREIAKWVTEATGQHWRYMGVDGDTGLIQRFQSFAAQADKSLFFDVDIDVPQLLIMIDEGYTREAWK